MPSDHVPAFDGKYKYTCHTLFTVRIFLLFEFHAAFVYVVLLLWLFVGMSQQPSSSQQPNAQPVQHQNLPGPLSDGQAHPSFNQQQLQPHQVMPFGTPATAAAPSTSIPADATAGLPAATSTLRQTVGIVCVLVILLMCVCIAILGVIAGHKLFIVTLSRFIDFGCCYFILYSTII